MRIQIEIYDSRLLVYKPEYSIDSINKLIEEHNLKGLRIFCPFEDDRINDFSFLREIRDIDELSIFHPFEIDFNFLYELKSIKKLALQSVFSKIDFSNLSFLEELYLEWNKNRLFNLNDLINLNLLSISNYKENNFVAFSKLPVKFLSIKNSKCTSLSGLNGLERIIGLQLGDFKKLIDITDLKSLTELRYIYFDGCKNVQNFDYLSILKKLEIVEFIDCGGIDSLDFLLSLEHIKQVAILGSTSLNNKSIDVLKTLCKNSNIKIVSNYINTLPLILRRAFINVAK